jgi:hypothetical protein
MTQVEIKITINTQDSDQIAALNELFRAIGGNTKPKVETPTAKVETPKVETPKVETPKPEVKGIKIEDVRALTAKKVGTFRREIKAKLTELGAPNVTSLDESLYGTFMDFLNDLK